MPHLFDEKILLITGGTGSFGNAVLQYLIKVDGFKEIRIFSRDEKKQYDMRKFINNPKIKFYVGDVRDKSAVDFAMKGVDHVFHAAALKQVPSCEFFPLEAVKTNVVGTENVLESAVRNKVQRVVVLSTDKAAYPINAMGMSKALMEKVMVARARNLEGDGSILCGTRYGNVMASRGSVIPLFVQQIKTQNPLTVTDPKMTRFLMSLDEAVELVLYAFKNGEQADLYVQKAPACTLFDLASALLEIFDAPNRIQIIGTRHGEKLYETLCTREEMAKSVDLDKYFKIPADNRDLNYGLYFEDGDLKTSELEDYNSHNTYRLTKEEVKSKLLSLDYIQEEILAWGK